MARRRRYPEFWTYRWGWSVLLIGCVAAGVIGGIVMRLMGVR
jgi:hypothetical protein